MMTPYSYKPCDDCVFNHEADGWNPRCSIENHEIYNAREQTAAELRAKGKDDSNVEHDYPCNYYRNATTMKTLLDIDNSG